MQGNLPSLERVRELLKYDAETGIFTWKVHRASNAMPGMVAGRRERDGYRRIAVDGVWCRAHRLAWLYVHGQWPREHIDHINGIRDDNAIANLREATNAQNLCNRGRTSRNKSGFKGVHWHGGAGQWTAQIRINGQPRHLGYFADPEAAHRAYVEAADRLHGAFARPS
jgi:hypothetical protein